MSDDAGAAEIVHSMRGTAAVIKGAAQLLRRRDDLRPGDRDELIRMIEDGATTLGDALAALRLDDLHRPAPPPDPDDETAFLVRVRGARPSVAHIERALELSLDDVVVDVRDRRSEEALPAGLRRRSTDL